MRIIGVTALLLALLVPVWSETTKDAPKLSDKALAPRAAQGERIPQLSDKAAAEIRTLQLRQAQLTIQAQQLLAQYQTQREQLDAEIKAAEERALKDALQKAGGPALRDADPAKYKVNDQSLAIVPTAGPSGAGLSEQKK